jgi:Leucine-rich repeat (LRR) protein
VLQAWTTISTSISVKEVERNVGELLERLVFLLEEQEYLGLRVDVGGQPLKRDPTSSLVDESSIFGMDDDKDAIVNSLLPDGASGGGMRVIAIVGMGGIGKTTLAQLVYNDDRLNNKHFDLKAWVCVSDDQFCALKLTKKILEGVDLRADSDNLNQLQIKLKEKLKGKKILLVLDDVWNIKRPQWECLSIPFKSGGAQEIRVLITTRNEKVASNMFASETHRINELQEKDCWLLFEKYAFQNLNLDARQEREELGREILKKCKGLPLAIKAIGSLLGSESNVKAWSNVLESELWHLPIEEIDIFPTLSLSYKHLPPHLRRCFAYCSIFPNDYAFHKDKLVLLWMAEGLLPQRQNKTMQEVGDDYFCTLVSRSLFQRHKQGKYIMHDLVSDLAKFISEPFTLRHEDGCSREIESNTRHFSYSFNKFDIEGFEVLQFAKRLRTLINLDFSLGSLFVGKRTQFSFLKLRCLRVLILPHYRARIELPDSIEELIFLRYLDISENHIESLPNTICKLYNLQILNLSYCKYLVDLPRDMHKLINLQILNLPFCESLVALPIGMHKLMKLQILNFSYCRRLAALPRDVHKLINLRHLNIEKTRIMEMPINLGKLKCLKTLSTFIVSNSGCGIEELRKLTNLQGSLSVLVLQNIESPTDAKGRNLRDMKYLENLELEWKGDTNALESHKIVLVSLQPHTNLKSLTIKGYGGTSFPDWVGDASFSNIASLRLENCKFCCSLPPLGQLHSLQYLWIVGLDGVVTIDRQFYGSGSPLMKPFGALKSLRFYDLLEWKEWYPFEAQNEGRAFPNLSYLSISNCPKLTSGLPAHLPSLAKLCIYNCPQLVASIPRASSHCKLVLEKCNTVLFNESPTGIQELFITSCCKLELPMHLNYSFLGELTLDGCGFLKSITLFPKLRLLQIWNCEDLESLTVGEQHEQDLLLSHIQINRCPNFAYFPQGGLRAPNLKEFSIGHCTSLRSLPEKMHMLLPSLESLFIHACPQVESFPEGGLPSNLNEITIFDCDKLFASRLGWGLQTLLCVRRFLISNKSEDAESFPDEGLLPTNLTYLSIRNFPNLKYLDTKGLKHLTALEELEITNCSKLERMSKDGLSASLSTLRIMNCPKFECMSEDGLPASLSTLMIFGCPLLEKELERKEGEEWVKIVHVPNKYIAGEWIK